MIMISIPPPTGVPALCALSLSKIGVFVPNGSLVSCTARCIFRLYRKSINGMKQTKWIRNEMIVPKRKMEIVFIEKKRHPNKLLNFVNLINLTPHHPRQKYERSYGCCAYCIDKHGTRCSIFRDPYILTFLKSNAVERLFEG